MVNNSDLILVAGTIGGVGQLVMAKLVDTLDKETIRIDIANVRVECLNYFVRLISREIG